MSPRFATDGSACFDLHAHLPTSIEVKTGTRFVHILNDELTIEPFERVLVPTGIVFDIKNSGWSVRLHSRSGLAFKQGLILANGEGIIDSDYVEPVFVCLLNVSGKSQTINHGDRICQAEVVELPRYKLEKISTRPALKTDRSGGFGSTGK